MKYYYNEQTDTLCIDPNPYTAYLADRGYKEVTKEFYDTKSKELDEKYKQEHLEEFEGDE